MAEDIIRPLHTGVYAEKFVKGVLKITTPKEIGNAINKIVDAEIGIIAVKDQSTVKSDQYRDFSYRTNEDRIKLRQQILKELVTLPRLDRDDNLKLGHGGAKPKTEVKKDKNIFIIIGLPAAGKSQIANDIADKYGAYIVDTDYATRKFPEFRNNNFGANIVHDEAKNILWGDPGLFDYCLTEGCNIVFPTVGYNWERIKKYGEDFKSKGYRSHLILVALDRTKAVRRAYERFIKSKRYVPLGLIFDFYSNEPTLTYYRIKRINESNKIFSSLKAISSDVKEGDKPVVIEAIS